VASLDGDCPKDWIDILAVSGGRGGWLGLVRGLGVVSVLEAALLGFPDFVHDNRLVV